MERNNMEVADITEAWLKQQHLVITPGVTIQDVFLKELTAHVDDRGDVTELWSTYWPEFESGQILPCKHSYQSATDPGVVKCWHLHARHTDQFTVTRGKLQVSLVDLRPNSPTFGQANKIIMGIQKPRFLQIPPGVMHGWKALGSVESLVVNFQSEVYNPGDEFKFTWNCVLEEIWGPTNG
jgi:dTDP-4-dehydrorhamnose 3,5-epimerase